MPSVSVVVSSHFKQVLVLLGQPGLVAVVLILDPGKEECFTHHSWVVFTNGSWISLI